MCIETFWAERWIQFSSLLNVTYATAKNMHENLTTTRLRLGYLIKKFFLIPRHANNNKTSRLFNDVIRHVDRVYMLEHCSVEKMKWEKTTLHDDWINDDTWANVAWAAQRRETRAANNATQRISSCVYYFSLSNVDAVCFAKRIRVWCIMHVRVFAINKMRNFSHNNFFFGDKNNRFKSFKWIRIFFFAPQSASSLWDVNDQKVFSNFHSFDWFVWAVVVLSFDDLLESIQTFGCHFWHVTHVVMILKAEIFGFCCSSNLFRFSNHDDASGGRVRVSEAKRRWVG